MVVVQIVVLCVLVCLAGCFNGGYCSSSEICTCPSGWTGNDCRQGTIWGFQTHICKIIIFEKLHIIMLDMLNYAEIVYNYIISMHAHVCLILCRY